MHTEHNPSLLKWLTRIGSIGKIMLFGLGWFLLPMASLMGSENNKSAPFSSDDSQKLWELGTVRDKITQVPLSAWERIQLAHEWAWDEYPDQVIIQEEAEIKWTRYLSAAINAPQWLDIGLTNRLRWEGFDTPFEADQEENTKQWASRHRFRASARWQNFRAQLEFQGATSGEDSDSDVVGVSTFSAGNVQQFFVAHTLPNVLETGFRSDLHAGRINLDIGSRRLVARSRFGNTSQAFDGFHWNLADEGQWRFRAFFSEVSLNTDAKNRIGLFTNSDSLFWGLSYENHQHPWSRIHLYYFGTDNDTNSEEGARTHSTFGLRLYQPSKAGYYDYDGESVWQVGTINDKDHLAHFQHLSLGYTFRFPWTPRIMAMYDYASGTDNPNGNNSHTFDGLFGARRGELTPTGLFGPFYRSNISSPGIRLILEPTPTVKLNVKFRAWYLAQSRDAWTNSGMQDPTGAAGSELGQDVEVRVQWDPSPNFSIDIGYDHFFKGSFITKQVDVPGNPPARDTNYFYVQTEARF